MGRVNKIRYSNEIRGYAWLVYQTAEGREAEREEGATEYGYHGNDVDPINTPSEYLADDDSTGRKGFFVVTEDDEEPELVNGWEVEKAEDVDEDWTYKDGSGYTVKVLHQFGDNSLLFVTYVG